MELSNERVEKVYKYDIDLSPDELRILRETALERIQNDDNALVEYAVISILMDKIASLDNVNKKLKKSVKKNKEK